MKKTLIMLVCSAMLAVSVNAEAGEHKFKHPQGEPPRHEQMAEKLAQDLGLTAEQKAQAEKIRADGREKVKPLMERAKKLHEEMDKLRQENMQEFEKILTPDQQEKFAKIKAEMKKHKGPRGPHPKFDDKEPRPDMPPFEPDHHPENIPEPKD